MTFNTGNPVGSTDARDLYDNAQNFDRFSLGQDLEYPDRLGVPRKSLAGIRAEVTEALSRLGYQVLGDYATGLVVQNYGQVFRKDSEFYRAAAELALPYALTGDWSVESASFVSVGDAVLRQEISGGSFLTASMIKYGSRSVSSRLADIAISTDYSSLAEAVADADSLYVPAGVHEVAGIIPLRSGQRIQLAPGAVLVQSTAGDSGVFSVAAGVSDVEVRGGSIRGPYYGGTPVPAPAYPNSNGAIRITGSYDNPCRNIRVEGVEIAGWGDYGIFAENVHNGSFNLNHIHTVGRDGMRFYGAVDTVTCLNHIHDIAPGFGGVAPNLNVYGITFTRRATSGSNPTIDPPSRFCVAANNIVRNCKTWKGLDTHGGQDITFANNIITGAHIAIGIDEGDTPSTLDSPPKRIIARGNILTRAEGTQGGAGINVSSGGASAMGEDVHLDGNIISGFGGTGSGGINFAYQNRFRATNNTMLDCEAAGINIPSGVRCTGFVLAGNTIKNLLGTAIAAITVQSVEAQGLVDGVTLIRESGGFTGFSLVTPSSSYGVSVSGEINQRGTMTLFSPGSKANIVGGSTVTQAVASCRVTSAGSLSGNFGVASCAKISTGVYDVTLSGAMLATSTMHPSPCLRSSSAGLIVALPTSTTVIRVSTFNLSGTPADAEFSLTVHGI